MNVQELISILLEEDDPPAPWALIEASVHLGTRGKTYNASFRGPGGEPVWRSTGLTDREKALALARQWEKEVTPKVRQPKQPVVHLKAGGLTYQEVASIVRVSERTVRKDEKSAMRKLRNHPALRQFWKEWLGGQIEESTAPVNRPCDLTPQEIEALLALAQTPLELQALRKVIALTRRLNPRR
jgi:hypothetical protein